MAVEILLPRLGWTMEEGTFGEWLKHDGDTVAVGDMLYTVESDKALNEVEALESGILRIAPDAPKGGDVIPVGRLLGYLVQPGEETPKAPGTAPANAALHEEKAPEQVFAPPPAAPAIEPNAAADPFVVPSDAVVGKGILPIPAISPRAQRIAQELGVEWVNLKGTGSSGRIVERDIRDAYARGVGKPSGPAFSTPMQAPAQEKTSAPKTQGTPTTRRVIAQRMLASAQTTAPVTLTTEADATELVKLREQLKQDNPSAQDIPTYTDILAKLCAQALGEHPALNGRLDGDEIVMESAVNIGIAADTERGLLVPVVRDAETKTLRQIAVESRPLLERARAGKLSADEMRGSTFTITNLGMYEIDAFTPIINLPECAILGVGRIVAKPVVIDGVKEIAVRQMMFLSLTFDHRLVDGAPAARFLQRVKQYIEKPYLWLVA